MRVLAIDDHAMLLAGLSNTLAQQFPDAHFRGARTAKEGLGLIREQMWDVVLLDLDLPDRSGLDLLKDIQLAAPELPVLILSAQAANEFGLRVLKAGAAGFLSKTGDPGELGEAVRKAVSGRRHISPALAEQMLGSIDRNQDCAPHELLSEREFQVLVLLASGKSVSVVAEQLSLSVKTVSTYRTRILEKMGMKTNADITYYAIKNNLLQ
jgi:two-component system invasion response regulator UvrY